MADIPTTELFAEWAKLKFALHFSDNADVPHVMERQIWWVSLGQNIGDEQNGKHKNFERPVLVLKRFGPTMFLAVPLSSKVKSGKYKVIFEQRGVKFTANLSQIRAISSKRLLRPLYVMEESSYGKILLHFQQLATRAGL